MKRNAIVCAPAFTGIEAVLEKWLSDNPGKSERDFFEFISTPSVERSVFVSNLHVSESVIYEDCFLKIFKEL